MVSPRPVVEKKRGSEELNKKGFSQIFIFLKGKTHAIVYVWGEGEREREREKPSPQSKCWNIQI
jgi:hypothetical protein